MPPVEPQPPAPWASTAAALDSALVSLDSAAPCTQWLDTLIAQGLDQLPPPGSGATLWRWRALARVAAHDLSLAKLFEGHTDALATLAELGAEGAVPSGASWGVWAAEAPPRRALLTRTEEGRFMLSGGKPWCSGAAHVTHGLMTASDSQTGATQLVRFEMRQPGIGIDASAWRAVGMAGSASVDLTFDGTVVCDAVGGVGDYLARPGFWQGGAGIAACWYGGTSALAEALRSRLASMPGPDRGPYRLTALGKVDLAMQRSAALIRATAAWIDAHPRADASEVALRVRLAAEDTARRVLDEVGRALGAAAFCRDARFARMAADLPVFVRQSHAERDFAALGDCVAARNDMATWSL